MIKKIILVFKTHFDIGFTDTAENVIKDYKGKMLCDVVHTCDSTKDMGSHRYVWTMPSWPLYQMLDGDEANKSDQAKLVSEFVRDGQLCWHGLPFTSHFDFCGLEDFLRGSVYSEKLSQLVGLPKPISAKMTDVPGHGMMLPTSLQLVGIRFLHIGANAFATPPDVPLLFNWEGPDGSQVLTMYSKASYGTSLEAPEDWAYPVWMALLQTHDNCGPQSAQIVNHIIQKAQRLYPEAEIVTGSMDEFYHELMKYNPQVPSIRGDLADTWIHGVGTYPKEISVIREVRGLLTRVEKALTLAKTENNMIDSSGVQQEIEKAYHELLMFGEHTWGLDIKTFMGEQRPYDKEDFLAYKESDSCKQLEYSWNEQRQRAANAMGFAQKAQTLLLEQMAGSASGKELVVFNPSSRKESRYVNINHLKDVCKGKAFKWEGRVIEPELISNQLHIFMENMPPLGFVSLETVDVQPKAAQDLVTKNFIENHKYKITVEPSTGKIIELLDKEFHKNLVDIQSPDGFAGYRYDRYGFDDINEFLRTYGYEMSDWGINDYGKKQYPGCKHLTYKPETIQVTMTENTIVISQRNTESAALYGDSEAIITTITLPRNTDDIFVNVSIKNKQETLFGESGYMTMPFQFENESIYVNKLGCLLDISKDFVKDANHVNYCIENAVVIADPKHAVTVYSKDVPLVSIDETGMFAFRSMYEKRKPNLYFNLYNNMWGTNFPQWVGGDFSFDFIVTSHLTESITAQYDRTLSQAEGTMAFMKDSFCVEPFPIQLPKNLRVTAMIPTPKGYDLRLRETTGQSSTAIVQLPDFVREAKLVDMTGQPITAASQRELRFSTQGFGIYMISFDCI